MFNSAFDLRLKPTGWDCDGQFSDDVVRRFDVHDDGWMDVDDLDADFHGLTFDPRS